MVKIIISQINLLLGIVNDILDLKLIESGKFVPKLEIFSPLAALNFVVSMFATLGVAKNSQIVIETVSELDKQDVCKLPKELVGD